MRAELPRVEAGLAHMLIGGCVFSPGSSTSNRRFDGYSPTSSSSNHRLGIKIRLIKQNYRLTDLTD